MAEGFAMLNALNPVWIGEVGAFGYPVISADFKSSYKKNQKKHRPVKLRTNFVISDIQN
jgi:hypothetical protein